MVAKPLRIIEGERCRLINEQWSLKINDLEKFLSILEVVTSFFGLFSFNSNKLLLLFMFPHFIVHLPIHFALHFLKIKINSHVKDKM
jgi:hypothetical protein